MLLCERVYTIKSDKLTGMNGDLTIAHISDLHGRRFGRNNQKLLEAIRRHAPDLVVMTGDMIDGDGRNAVFFSLVKALAAHYPVYYVRGNHEQRLVQADIDRLITQVSDAGAIVMDNTKNILLHKGATIEVGGAWSHRLYERDPGPVGDDQLFGAEDLYRAVGTCDRKNYAILLIHTPAFFKAYMNWGADLSLCGHMHGGMIRLPWVGGVLSPYRRFFPAYDGGIYKSDEQVMVVSRGLGNGKVGFRFLNKPEVVIVKLTGGQEPQN